MYEGGEKSTKYVAIKIEGMNHFLWFKSENVAMKGGVFIGIKGWGKNGAFTEITCRETEIISTICSDELQYEN